MRNEVQLQELYEGLFDGPHATPKPSGEGPIFLGIKNITEDGRLDLNNIRHISETEFPKWTKRVIPREGDIVFSYEATLHRYAIIPKGFRGCLGRRMALIRPDTSKVNTDYLFYYLFSDEWREEVGKYILTGATVDRIPLSKTPEFKVKIPEKREQDKIASIIKSYDNLIENNSRRIAILEEIAQSLYREWFVNFRFPGHGNTKFIDSPLGKIPEGWSSRKLIELTTKIGSGATPKGGKGVYKSEGISLIRSMNVCDGRFEFKDLAFIDEAQSKKLENVKVEELDILLNITGASVARCCLVPKNIFPARVNQHVAIIRADEEKISPFYLFCYLVSDAGKNKLLTFAQGGATREALTKSTLENLNIVFPEEHLLNQFNDISQNIYRLKDNLDWKNRNLKISRDLLLPKLISGNIRLSSE